MYGFDKRLDELVSSATAGGGLDFIDVCGYLPDKAETSEKLDLLLEALAERGLRVRANRSACGDIAQSLAPRPQRPERGGDGEGSGGAALGGPSAKAGPKISRHGGVASPLSLSRRQASRAWA